MEFCCFQVSTRTKGENEGDQGEYRCVVRSDKGALVSGPLHLRVAGNAFFILSYTPRFILFNFTQAIRIQNNRKLIATHSNCSFESSFSDFGAG